MLNPIKPPLEPLQLPLLGKTVDSLFVFIDQNHIFAENQNGRYGP